MTVEIELVILYSYPLFTSAGRVVEYGGRVCDPMGSSASSTGRV